MRDPYNAFCAHTDARLAGAKSGTLKGLTFAAKDLFDVAGHVTGGGNPDWLAKHKPAERTAPVVQKLADAGATMTGKTHTDELSRGIFGENAHYGTPVNPKAPGRLPGGSSSGSAAATAGSLVDFALGTDTGGSVRVPASFCGLYGLRPTHGRLPFDGVLGQAPSFDTIGWFAREPALFGRIGEALLGIDLARAFKPKRLVIAADTFALAEPATANALQPAIKRIARLIGNSETRPISSEKLSLWLQHQTALQGREAWTTFGDWIDRNNPRFGFEVADNFLRGKQIDDAAVAAGQKFRAARRAEIGAWLDAGTVVALPTAPFPAPLAGQTRSAMGALRARVIGLTCVGGMLGVPQINLPLASVDGLPVGLSLMAAPGGDAMLLALAREIPA